MKCKCGELLPEKIRVDFKKGVHRDHVCLTCNQLLQWHERIGGTTGEAIRMASYPVECDCDRKNPNAIMPICRA